MGIEAPLRESRALIQAVNLENKAMATSGDYRNYHEYEGRFYPHIINPLSGFPIDHSVASVSVIADSCTIADAMATALFAMGHETGMKLAAEFRIQVEFDLLG